MRHSLFVLLARNKDHLGLGWKIVVKLLYHKKCIKVKLFLNFFPVLYVTLAASLVRYEYDSGEKISRAIPTHLFQAGNTKTLSLYIFRPNF